MIYKLYLTTYYNNDKSYNDILCHIVRQYSSICCNTINLNLVDRFNCKDITIINNDITCFDDELI